MTINGINADTQAIAAGIYKIICEANEEALVAFGMIPKWAIDLLELELRRKVIEESARQMNCTVEEVKPHLCEKAIREIVQAVSHKVAVGIYGEAAKAGKMCV